MYQAQFGPRLTPMVKNLIILNCVIFLIQRITSNSILPFFALNPDISHIYIWQFLSYAFLHGGLTHILFNMLSLWMFGSELEEYWNSGYFLKFYLFCCLLGAVFVWILNSLGWDQGLVVGASGGIYGILIAYAMFWPDRQILFFGFFPMKVKHMVGILMLMIAFSQQGNVAHMAHLGGALGGFLFVKYAKTYFFSSFGRFSLLNWFNEKRRQSKQLNDHLDKEELNRILDKITENGNNMDCLTSGEKAFLKNYSEKKQK